jgi:hypothetical protein
MNSAWTGVPTHLHLSDKHVLVHSPTNSSAQVHTHTHPCIHLALVMCSYKVASVEELTPPGVISLACLAKATPDGTEPLFIAFYAGESECTLLILFTVLTLPTLLTLLSLLTLLTLLTLPILAFQPTVLALQYH